MENLCHPCNLREYKSYELEKRKGAKMQGLINLRFRTQENQRFSARNSA